MNSKDFMQATVGASTGASAEDKARALKAATEMPSAHGEGFWFNALLNLLARGVAPTEKNLVSESKRIEAAQADVYAEQVAKRERFMAAHQARKVAA